MPAVDAPLRRRLLPSHRAQSGFLSSSFTLALVLVGLLVIYLVFQRRSRAAEHAHAARARGNPRPDEGVHLLDGVAYRESSFVWSPGARYFLMGWSSLLLVKKITQAKACPSFAGVSLLVFSINVFSQSRMAHHSGGKPIRRR